jgi:hypothetical protein
VTSREELNEELRRLWEVSPPVLQGSPSPDSVRSSRERCEIELAAHGVDVAADLHARYGKLVELRVGMLDFPNPRPPRSQKEHSPAGRTAASTHGLRVALPEGQPPIRIPSGFSTTVLVEVSNDSAEDCHLHTNRVLQTAVVDAEGTIIGCFAGMQQMPLKIYAVRPQETVRIPALVGTASLRPELGWAVPPGPWELIVNLTLGGDLQAIRRKRIELWSAPLPLVVDVPVRHA